MHRILLVLPTIQLGGMETHCVDLAAELCRRGFVVRAVIPSDPAIQPLQTRFLAAGAEVRTFHMDARAGRLAQARDWPRMATMARAWRPDVVHVHTGGPSGGVALVAAARWATTARVILTEHTAPDEGLPRRQRLTRPWMDRLSHVLVAVSRSNAMLRVSRLGAPRNRFAVVLNGVPVREVPPEVKAQNRLSVRARYGIDPAGVMIGSVVRLVDGKGLDDLLRAFALLGDDQTVTLLLVGDGPLRAELEALSRELGVQDRVYFVGHHADPVPFLDAMDLFVLAVPSGSMSIALLEAMSRGVPPVITFCGPEEAVLPDVTGLDAPSSDPEGLARVLMRGTRDVELRSRLAIAATEHVARHFSIQRVADDLLEIYRGAKAGVVPADLRFDAPPNPRPGDRR